MNGLICSPQHKSSSCLTRWQTFFCLGSFHNAHTRSSSCVQRHDSTGSCSREPWQTMWWPNSWLVEKHGVATDSWGCRFTLCFIWGGDHSFTETPSLSVCYLTSCSGEDNLLKVQLSIRKKKKGDVVWLLLPVDLSVLDTDDLLHTTIKWSKKEKLSSEQQLGEQNKPWWCQRTGGQQLKWALVATNVCRTSLEADGLQQPKTRWVALPVS